MSHEKAQKAQEVKKIFMLKNRYHRPWAFCAFSWL